MSIDIVITTYNRPDAVGALVKSLEQRSLISNIIVVDSSEESVNKFSDRSNIRHVRTTRKNQPYQRYLGYQNALSEIIVFLDDDMELVDEDFDKKIIASFITFKVSAVAINFKDKHTNTSLAEIPQSVFNKKSSLKTLINWFTGYPELQPGKLGLCGIRGTQPQQGGVTEWFSGGAFAARREELYINFNFQLFELYDKQLGKGEDVMIAYTLFRQHKIYYLPDLLFYHNDQKNSAYSKNFYNFSRRVSFSRLYLSLEKTRLDGSSPFYARIHFQWYMLWRNAGLLMNLALHPDNKRLQIMKGSVKGWAETFSFNFKHISHIKN